MAFKLKICAILTLSIIGFGRLFAQGGSNYSVFGLGDIIHATGAGYEALCGTAIAFPQQSGINTVNPAMWSFATMSRLQVGYRFNQNLIQSGDKKLLQNNGKLNGITAIFVIDTGLGLSASFGIIPYTWVNYLSANPIDRESGEIPIKGKAIYDGKGGISKAYLGASIKIFDNFSLGASFFSTFGSTIHNRNTEFYDSYTSNYYVRQTDYIKGIGLHSGIFFTPAKNFSLGAYLENHFSMDYDRDLRYSVQRNLDTVFLSSGSIKMPATFGVGASYLSGKFLFGGDISVQNYSNLDFNPGAQTEFGNNIIISLGAERLGNDNINADILDRISYKFGAGYNQLYYSVYGEDISELSLSVGMGIPLPGTGMLNTAFVFGTRGTENLGLVKEYFGRMTVDVSIGEIWFKPFKREY